MNFIKNITHVLEEIPIYQWTLDHVGTWLKNLNYDQNFIDLFRFHEIDGEILFMLDKNDLEKMGIVQIGKQKKFIKNLNNLKLKSIEKFVKYVNLKENNLL